MGDAGCVVAAMAYLRELCLPRGLRRALGKVCADFGLECRLGDVLDEVARMRGVIG